MKQLSSFVVLSINSGYRISYTYDEINDETGDLVSQNNKESFFAVDNDLKNHIEGIRNFINENKLAED